MDNAGINAILLMAGSGERFGSDTPKQFHRLAGKKIYLHTLEKFIHSGFFEEIILVCAQNWIEEVRADIAPLQNVRVVEGGKSRQESSYLGLLACEVQTQVVVIHDAVRPFVTPQILRDNVDKARLFKAVDTCIPSADTIVHAPDNTCIATIPKRAEYLRGQTPQSFDYPLILAAHEFALKEGLKQSSDDCSLVLKFGKAVHVVPGDEHNIKITTELDLFLAEQVLRRSHKQIPHEDLCLKGKKFVITGGTGGIGQALCHLLRTHGATSLIISRSASEYSADLTHASSAEDIFNHIYKEHGPIDGLINGIGLLKNKPLSHLSSAEIDQLISSNLTSTIYSCKYAQIKPSGHIVNIASSSYTRGRGDCTIYSSAKAAIVNFTQGFAEERPDIYINALIPQRTNTPMRASNFPAENPDTLLHPDEVAKEIIQLLRQTSLTGATVEVRKK